MNTREKILSAIQQALKPVKKLALPSSTRLPCAGLTQAECLYHFSQKAHEAGAIIHSLKDLSELPSCLIEHLPKAYVTQPIHCIENSILEMAAWEKYSEISLIKAPADENTKLSLVYAVYGIAETGTVLFRAEQSHSTLIHFLPEVHIVLLKSEDIVPNYETAWDLMNKKKIPRGIHFVTGPSRTGDIEQKILTGAHGPKLLYIYIYSENKL